MAENELSQLPQSNDEENLSNEDSKKKNSNSTVIKPPEEPTKRHKNSFISNLRKKFTFPKKSKSKESTNNKDIINTPANHNKMTKNNDYKSDKGNSTDLKQENCDSVVRRSFGKGNLSSDVSVTGASKNRESLVQTENQPQSMHIASSHPPRNGVLASFGWYWGPLSRSEATHRLRHQEDGSFLVRDSEGDPNKFTLSFRGSGQIFHNRILQQHTKYAFLPDEEFDSIPDLIADAMRRSATSTYCFSRSTDAAPANAAPIHTDTPNCSDGPTPLPIDTCTAGPAGVHHKHEVRLLKPISRFRDGPRSLKYLSRFLIRHYTRFQDLCKLLLTPDIVIYLQDPKYYI